MGRKCSSTACLEFHFWSASKAGNIGKVSSSEPLFAGWFAKALAEVDPSLANCFAVVWWKGGDEKREKMIFEKSNSLSDTVTTKRFKALKKHSSHYYSLFAFWS